MTKSDKNFKVNYDGREIRPDETMVPFEYTELDAEENCTNKECIRTVTQGGRKFRVIFKAVPSAWEKQAASALSLVENEVLGHYSRKGDISMDAVRDEYELEMGLSKSAEDEIIEQMELNETVKTFVDLISSLIEKIPKLGLAVLLLHTGVRGKEFYTQMLLSRDPANRIRQQAESILQNGLMNFDISKVKCYKSKNDEVYRERAYRFLNEIVKNCQ